jgi:hypothetical protein
MPLQLIHTAISKVHHAKNRSHAQAPSRPTHNRETPLLYSANVGDSKHSAVLPISMATQQHPKSNQKQGKLAQELASLAAHKQQMLPQASQLLLKSASQTVTAGGTSHSNQHRLNDTAAPGG